MMMVKISFLIPVYNQSEELRKCINSITQYSGDDIEIVVSDDCSTEDLEGIVAYFHDNRIKHYRNNTNVGLDGNILFGISKCRGEFVFLLRTRDCIISEAIDGLIDAIDNKPDVVCISGTCLDDDGIPRVFYEDKLFDKGTEALEAHYMLPFHPSGFAFKRSFIDCALFEKYLKNYPYPRVWFMVDRLIRLYLTMCGDFYIMSNPLWVYTYTSRNPQKTVHKLNGENIYSQSNIRNRYKSELQFIFGELSEDNRGETVNRCFSYWLEHATWWYLFVSENKSLQEHYGCYDGKKIDINKERDDFLAFSDSLEREFNIGQEFKLYVKQAVQENIDYRIIKEEIKEKEAETIKSFKQMLWDARVDENDIGTALVERLKKRGISRIGIYGMGYIGKEIWNELKNNPSISITRICDQRYPCRMQLNGDTIAIPPSDISLGDVDLWLITSIRYFNEIIKTLPEADKKESIETLLTE